MGHVQSVFKKIKKCRGSDVTLSSGMPAKRRSSEGTDSSRVKKSRVQIQQQESDESDIEASCENEVLKVNKLQHECSVQHSEALTGISQIIDENANNLQNEDSLEEDILSLESVINNISFVKMISSLQQVTPEKSIPIVSRNYEEKFMRESNNSSEKSCIMGKACEGMFIDPTQPFIATQFVLPNVYNQDRGMCIFCLRRTTQLLFYKTIHHGYDIKCVIQKYGNICNQPGEYSSDAMLVCHPNGPVHCMPLPIVAHQRNRYVVVDVGGKKYVKQKNVDVQPF